MNTTWADNQTALLTRRIRELVIGEILVWRGIRIERLSHNYSVKWAKQRRNVATVTEAVTLVQELEAAK